MNLLKFLKYILFLFIIGLCSVSTSAENACNFTLNPTSQKSEAEISSSSKANLFFSSYINSHFGKVTEIKTFFEKAVIPKLEKLNIASSEENKWLSLLYLKENSTLAIHPNGTFLSRENQKFFQNPELVDAWRYVSDLKPSGISKLTQDVDFLQVVNRQRGNPDLINKIGSDKYDDIIKNYAGQCKGCDAPASSASEAVKHLPPHDEMLESLEASPRNIMEKMVLIMLLMI